MKQNKKKAAVPKIEMVCSQDCMQTLRHSWNLWCRAFRTSNWPAGERSRKDPGWWDKAAHVCHKYGVSPDLLIFLVKNFANYRMEDASVLFSDALFRSEHVMERALANFRSQLNAAYETPLQHVWYFRSFKKDPEAYYNLHRQGRAAKFVPPSILTDNVRMFAQLSVELFGYIVRYHVKLAFGRHGIPCPDRIHDQLAYKLCDGNPFALLSVAKTEPVRALAAANCHMLARFYPWHEHIWEGIASEHSLGLPDRMAGCDVKAYFPGHQIGLSWPANPFCINHVQTELVVPSRPGLVLVEFPTHPPTESYLRAMLDSGTLEEF